MRDKLLKLKNEALAAMEKISSPADLEDTERKFLGRQDGELTAILRGLKDLPAEEKPAVGKLANEIKKELEEKLEEKRNEIKKQNLLQSSEQENFDTTLPGLKMETGRLHPTTQVRQEVEDIFRSMGFEIFDSPELENDYYCFESLNIPPNHPARDAWDTYYVSEKRQATAAKAGQASNKAEDQRSAPSAQKLLLRTHTSAAQVRYMEKNKPPFKVIVPGKCFRHEATDASHEHTFYQVEGFVVGENISIANLITTLKSFLSMLFGQEVKVRLRPGYFPFVEPGFEFDFGCLNCHGKGCPVCKHSGWVELLGCGMIHPKVFEYAGYPKNKYTGFAFGTGLDRLAMMKYKINDIRLFHGGDLRFLKQF